MRRYKKLYRKLFAAGTIQRHAGRFVMNIPEIKDHPRRYSINSNLSSNSTPFRNLTHSPASSSHHDQETQNKDMSVEELVKQEAVLAQKEKKIRVLKIAYNIKPLKIRPIDPVFLTEESEETGRSSVRNYRHFRRNSTGIMNKSYKTNTSFENLKGISTQNSFMFKSRESTAEGRKRGQIIIKKQNTLLFRDIRIKN